MEGGAKLQGPEGLVNVQGSSKVKRASTSMQAT